MAAHRDLGRFHAASKAWAPGCLVAVALASCFVSSLHAEDVTVPPKGNRHQITGLFMPEREDDLREAVADIPGVRLLSIDFKNAEATFDYDASKVFPGAKPEQIVERFDAMLRQASNHTFGVKPLRTLPLEKLQRVEIGITGLDCKACSLAVYETIYRLPGVEMATASFKESRATALIDPEKIDKAKLEMALKQRGVTLKMP